MLLNKGILQDIMMVTCSILQNNFFYDQDSLARFIDIFTDELEFEYACFQDEANHEMKLRLKHDKKARNSFTTYFVSAHLRDILIDYLHFTEMELEAFDNILPKYSEVAANDIESCNQRTHY